MSAICLITALPSEAQPLTGYFKLSGLAHPHIRLFKGEHCYLLQCGIGKLNAAAATATMLETLPDVEAVINVGIAGSDQPIGEVLLAHHIVDGGSGQQWYPHLPPQKHLDNIKTIGVKTVDKPSRDYTPDTAFDMEAAGIALAATKKLDLAFVHSLKVISDNPAHGIENINMQSVNKGIESALPAVKNLMAALPFDTQVKKHLVDKLLLDIIGEIHYTETEKHSLQQLLNRHNALFGRLPDAVELTQYKSAKAIRQQLQQTVSAANVAY